MPDKTFSVLIIEDDDIDAKALQKALNSINITHNIYRAYDGIEALDLLRAKKPLLPCIIIVDINMPRMNGIEFIQSLRTDPTYSKSVVFILTTSNSNIDRAAAYDFNVAGYILKENVGKGFCDFTNFLSSYIKCIELP